MSSDKDDANAHGNLSLTSEEYWNDAYTLEFNNFKNFGDHGAEWFGSIIGKKMIDCIQKFCDLKQEDIILDVGCGNALLLIKLAKLGFSNLYGIDYSSPAIKLADAIVHKENIGCIKLQVFDFLTDDVSSLPTFKIVLDKGTYDVIEPSGLFLIVCCNWTQTELNEHFNDVFEVVHTIPTPKFQFGGAIGNTISAILYKKNV
ncbi:EEF1A lysine methyltransferase 2 isoform X2 [Daktulosphaira vitifoliae]|uniref:EEF1A lysine methyltransferase 2 isoform X2 n=1 Tax=Daktulosphaira vitifoliae TaxID=58002 RepID=UPI0021AAB65B|nr:EEF1A lysine methyltransferase 2 isoform X2 [Daktulosphaira vitifoliae]